jgi:hypothetical protein
VRNLISTVATWVSLYVLLVIFILCEMWGRTETRGAFASEGLKAHFVRDVTQIIILVWDSPDECHLECRALFEDVFDLGRREEAFLTEILQLGKHLESFIHFRDTRCREPVCAPALAETGPSPWLTVIGRSKWRRSQPGRGTRVKKRRAALLAVSPSFSVLYTRAR